MRRRQGPQPVAIRSDAGGRSLLFRPLLAATVCWGMLVLVVSCLYPGTATAARDQVHFAAPYSGKKVTSYTVELPVSRNDRRTFEIPADCDEVTRAARAGSSSWGKRQERRVWHKVDGDCRYHAFLNRYDRKPVRDFVTGFDIWNAALCDLLIEPRCSDPEARPGDPDCQPFPPGIPRISQLVHFAEPDAGQPHEYAEPCRLENGIFRGWVVADPAGTHCIPDANAPGFRVISVDYADVNGDGTLDAVLRLVPLSPGASRIPLVLPLTRTSPDSALEVPAQTTMPTAQPLP